MKAAKQFSRVTGKSYGVREEGEGSEGGGGGEGGWTSEAGTIVAHSQAQVQTVWG